MPKFAIERIKSIKGKQSFYDLKIDGIKQFDTFSEEIEHLYKSELLTLYARMDSIANLKSLPESKFRDITANKEKVKEYELKTRHLRVYAIHIKDTGKVIILCGFKNRQKKDIRRFRSLKKQVLKYL